MLQSLKMQGHIYRHRKNKDIKCSNNNNDNIVIAKVEIMNC